MSHTLGTDTHPRTEINLYAHTCMQPGPSESHTHHKSHFLKLITSVNEAQIGDTSVA